MSRKNDVLIRSCFGVLVACLLPGTVLPATPEDNINPMVTPGAVRGDVHLTWTGGGSGLSLYRSFAASGAGLPGSSCTAESGANGANDGKPTTIDPPGRRGDSVMSKMIECSKVDPSSGCTYVVRGKDEEQVMKGAMEHAKQHGIRQMTPELTAKVKAAICDER